MWCMHYPTQCHYGGKGNCLLYPSSSQMWPKRLNCFRLFWLNVIPGGLSFLQCLSWSFVLVVLDLTQGAGEKAGMLATRHYRFPVIISVKLYIPVIQFNALFTSLLIRPMKLAQYSPSYRSVKTRLAKGSLSRPIIITRFGHQLYMYDLSLTE